MISSEVQRTLVKSAPELWAELSDPAALARHLGELGDIRITRVHPEEKVEWEAADTTGSVAIKPSGWGTRVTLTVTREVAPQIEAGPQVDAEPEIDPGPQPMIEAEQTPGIEAQPAPQIWVSPEPLDDTAGEPPIEEEPATLDASCNAFESAVGEPPAHELAPEPKGESRRGLFARLFRRRRAEEAVEPEPHEAFTQDETFAAQETFAPEESIAPEAEIAPHDALEPWGSPTGHPGVAAAFEPQVYAASMQPARRPEPPAALERASDAAEDFMADPQAGATLDPPETALAEPQAGATSEPPASAVEGDQPAGSVPQATDISAALREAEEVAAEQVTAVLTSMLDRLGAAHHRPFSRA
jgi:pilus assembly protein FimV